MCRRVALARAIAFARSGLGRDAAILDEPLKGLDNAMKKRIVPRFIDAFDNQIEPNLNRQHLFLRNALNNSLCFPKYTCY